MPKLMPEILLTFLELDPTSSTPKYLQIYAQIRSAVITGKLKAGDRMPSSRALASELRLSRNSLIAAYNQLAIEGYLSSEPGSGTFVTDSMPDPSYSTDRSANIPNNFGPDVLSEKRKLKYNFPTAQSVLEQDSRGGIAVPFQLSVTDMEHFPFQVWARIAARAYRYLQHKNLGYSDSQGYAPLRQAITEYLRLNRSIDCSPEQVLIVNGSRQALHIASEMLLGKGDKCWTEDPGYPGVKNAVLRFGGQMCPIPVNEHGLDVNYALTNCPDAKIAFITPSHQYPLGHIMPLSQRLQLLEWSKNNDTWIVEDDYDSEFRFKGRPIPALMGLDKDANVIYVGTFSKIMFPALRIAYMVLPDVETARKFTYAKTLVDRQNPIMDQIIMADFMIEGHFLRHIRRMRLIYRNSQERLLALLAEHFTDEISVEPDDSGMFVVAWLGRNLKASEIVELAKINGIILINIADFSMKHALPEGILMGFTGFKPIEMARAVAQFAEIIKSRLQHQSEMDSDLGK